jgi:excisionase family DNA binding protein
MQTKAKQAQGQQVERVGYSVAEVAAMTSFSKAFIRLEIQRGHLTAIKRGRRVMIPRKAFEAYTAPDPAA